jgi:phage-related protein
MKLGWTGRWGLALAAILLVPSVARADRWDVLREIGEGDREIRRERREAVREILRADSGWEVAREIGEGAREIRREKREKRREVRRAIRDELFRR